MNDDQLPHREPQQSDEARLDRSLSWSGRIVPPATPCTDLHLMARLLAALQNLPEQTDPTDPKGPP